MFIYLQMCGVVLFVNALPSFFKLSQNTVMDMQNFTFAWCIIDSTATWSTVATGSGLSIV
jgi:hypothetical protein